MNNKTKEDKTKEKNEDIKFEAVEKKVEVSSKKVLDVKKRLVFKGNRTFELYIGKKLIIFGPKECQEVDASILDHPDFKRQSHYFVVKEA